MVESAFLKHCLYEEQQDGGILDTSGQSERGLKLISKGEN